jgi:nucleoside-diphosphate-sugar epimerase
MPSKAGRILVVGCGYVGLPLALHFRQQGYEVGAWVRSAESAEALKRYDFEKVVVGSVADEALWDGLGDYDGVIHGASSGRGGAEAYREVFLEGARRMVERQKVARKLFISSTSVYGQTEGEIVTEELGAEPATETGKILREAEEVALAGGAIVVRSAGIYGPGRGVLFEKLRRGEAVIEGDGARWMNQIHRDDLVSALAFLWERGESGEIYNASDNEPVRARDFYAWGSEFLGVAMPPSGAVKLERKRGVTSKRVSNAKLRGLGWAARFPSFRDGLGEGS